MARSCDESCMNFLYIGEGDFICSVVNELVIVDWTPFNYVCIRKKKKEPLNEKKPKWRFLKK